MSSTRKQKERESMAVMADELIFKGNRYSRWLRGKNREVEKRKRQQFNHNRDDERWK